MKKKCLIYTLTIGLVLFQALPIHAQSSKETTAKKEILETVKKQLGFLFQGKIDSAIVFFADPYYELDGAHHVIDHPTFKKILQETKDDPDILALKDKDITEIFDFSEAEIYDYEETKREIGLDEIGFPMKEGDYIFIVPPKEGIDLKGTGGVYRKIEGKWRMIAGS